MPVNFYEALPCRLRDGCVAAMGTQHPKDEIKEICVWVYQSSPNDAGDAAATEMSTHDHAQGQAPHFLQVAGKRWLLPVKKISQADFRAGRAFAVALALVVEDRAGEKKERVVWWGQPVELQDDVEKRVDTAIDALKLAAKDPAKAEELLKGRLGDPLELQNL
jgi:hypothetical protein